MVRCVGGVRLMQLDHQCRGVRHRDRAVHAERTQQSNYCAVMLKLTNTVQKIEENPKLQLCISVCA